MNLVSSNKKILIVEDERDILLTLQAFLELEGYEVRIASNGREALDLLSDGEMPDLILLDMKMPVMDGWQFAAKFREVHGHNAPILVMTAAADAAQRAREVDARGWVGKPFDLNGLLKKIEICAKQGKAS